MEMTVPAAVVQAFRSKQHSTYRLRSRGGVGGVAYPAWTLPQTESFRPDGHAPRKGGWHRPHLDESAREVKKGCLRASSGVILLSGLRARHRSSKS